MLELNLPSFPYKLKQKDAKLFLWDDIRRKYVVLTPEEWVRQHFVHYLTGHRGVPSSLVTVEHGQQYNSLTKRCDIMVWNNELKPVLMVECKASHVALGENALAQIGCYNSELQVPYLSLTNGMVHYHYRKEGSAYVQIDELPAYTSMAESAVV